MSEKSPTRRSGGPRTAAGKKRTRLNALRHAVTSKAVLPHETKFFRRQMRSFQFELQTEGVLENDIAAELVINRIQYWRCLVFESTEFGKRQARANQEWIDRKEAAEAESILRMIKVGEEGQKDPISPNRMADLLEEMKSAVENNQIDADLFLYSISKACGEKRDIGTAWIERFLVVYRAAQDLHEEKKKQLGVDGETAKKTLLSLLSMEISHMKLMADSSWVDAWLLPDSPTFFSDGVSEKRARYRTMLEREFDGKLDRLERLRRMRPNADNHVNKSENT